MHAILSVKGPKTLADFEFAMDMDKIFPRGIEDKNLAFDMVNAGQDVMLKAIEDGESRHRITGDMVNSLYKTKPILDKKGDVIGRIKFGADSKTDVSKAGKKFDRTN